MKYSVIIKGATVIDGSGAPGFQANVGVIGDKIAGINVPDDAQADTVINASGKILCPGFIEVHTHYDPQLCWDSFATPALEHGVTTVITGNCSLSLAPVDKPGALKATRMFNRIEDLSEDFFSAAVPYCWETFPDYLAWLAPRLEINVGAVIGHSNLRHYVMGGDAQKRAATDAELQSMCAMLREAAQAGAFGLSTTYDHVRDERDIPVASAWAATSERIALARAMAGEEKTFFQCNVNPLDPEKRLAQFKELAEISASSQVVCSALGVMENPIFPGAWKDELAFLAGLNRSGGRVYAESQVRPLDMTFSLSGNWIGAFYMRHWAPIMLAPLSDRKALFTDPARRGGLSEDLNHFQSVASLITVLSVTSEENRKYVGRTIAEIANSERKTLAGALIDISLADDLKTQFDWSNVFHADSEAVAAILQDPFILLGGSDAGAHVAQFSGEGDATHLLAHYVREKGYFSLEQGIALLTGNLASKLGIQGRGRVQPGCFADLVLFDIERLVRGPQHLVHDLPGGGARFMQHASGIDSVFVNGELVWNGMQYLSKKAGRLV